MTENYKDLCEDLKINPENPSQERFDVLKTWCAASINPDFVKFNYSEQYYFHLLQFAKYYLDVFLPLSCNPNNIQMALKTMTPLEHAAIYGFSKFIEKQSNKDCSIINPITGRSLLHMAASYGQEQSIHELLKKKLPLTAKDINGDLAIHLVLTLSVPETASSVIDEAISRRTRIFEKLLNLDRDLIMEKNIEGYNIAHKMAMFGFIKLLNNDFLEKIIPLLTQKLTYTGQTPLHLAILNAQELIAVKLLSFSELVNIPDNKQRTPLHEAASCGSFNLIEALLNAGAKIDACDNDQKTAIQLAVDSENVSALEVFKKFNLLGRYVNTSQQSILHYAVIQQKLAAVKWLLDNTDLVSFEDINSKTPGNYAHGEILSLFPKAL
jgi:ankyrin repeat protein